MKTRSLAVMALLTAMAVGTNYAMVSLYNVKFMDLIVFVGGFCFGPITGALIGIISWSVYGSINPMGFSFNVWVATMLAESLYGIVGGLLGKTTGMKLGQTKNENLNVSLFFAAIGIFLTLLYDAITNTVFGLAVNWPVVFSIVVGFVPFGILHTLSNAVFFGLGCYPAIKAVSGITGERKNVRSP